MNEYHSIKPLTDYLVGGLIAVLTIVCPVGTIYMGSLTNLEESIKINKVGNNSLPHDHNH